MNKHILLTILISSICLIGCSKNSHFKRLMTLKGIADEQKSIGQFVQEQDKRFDELAQVVQSGDIQQYKGHDDIQEDFGKPVFQREVMRKGMKQNMWVYRYATKYFNANKVYLYFDESNNLVDWISFLNCIP